jgi:hypothetical protein
MQIVGSIIGRGDMQANLSRVKTALRKIELETRLSIPYEETPHEELSDEELKLKRLNQLAKEALREF